MSRTLAREALIGIVLLMGLLFFAAARYPASLSVGGWASFLATAGALCAYGAAAVWAAISSMVSTTAPICSPRLPS